LKLFRPQDPSDVRKVAMGNRTIGLFGLVLVFASGPVMARASAKPFLSLGAEIEPPRGYVELCAAQKNVCDDFRQDHDDDSEKTERTDQVVMEDLPSQTPILNQISVPLEPTGAIVSLGLVGRARVQAGVSSENTSGQSGPDAMLDVQFSADNPSRALGALPEDCELAAQRAAAFPRSHAKMFGLYAAPGSASLLASFADNAEMGFGPDAWHNQPEDLSAVQHGACASGTYSGTYPREGKIEAMFEPSVLEGDDLALQPLSLDSDPLLSMTGTANAGATTHYLDGKTMSVDAIQPPVIPTTATPQLNNKSDAKARDPDDQELAKILAKINKHVNEHVHQKSDMATYGVPELWRPAGDGPHAVGDCEDLAIEKRIELISAHFPPERLFFAVVFAANVGLHTVLVARLDRGDVVLDSRTPYIEPWERSPYLWLAIEKPGQPQVWRRIA